MKTLTVVDPSLSTDNLGDEIIFEAVEAALLSVFPQAYIYRVPSHDVLTDRSYKFIDESDFTFLGGSNLLSSKIGSRSLWRLRWSDVFRLKAVAIGVGWNDYQRVAPWKARFKLRQVMRGDKLHSVRDQYTANHLASAGVPGVNTSCPTTWSLSEEHCRTIPQGRATDAVFTLTAWRPDMDADRAMVRCLKQQYRTVYFFPQMRSDLEYFDRLGVTDVVSIEPSVRAYDEILDDQDVDYVGTRLHAGIRALQRGRRTLIVSVDNRAIELGADIGLPLIARSAIPTDLSGLIETDRATRIRLPVEEIGRWRAQFGD